MVTSTLFNVRFSPHWKTASRRCCEKLLVPLIIVFTFLGFSPNLQAQDASPCDCVQRWEKGAHWNEDGSIDDAPNAPSPLGVIRCANAAETQSQIVPNGCTYNPEEFTIDVSGSDCIDPSTGESVAVDNPTEGEPIIWLNFDARPHSSNFEVQINDNSGDRIGFALYYSSSPTSGVNENGISGDCSSLILVACGVESSNTWNTLPVPDSDQPTNYYLAIWDQDADGDLKVNNFKARFGCEDDEEEEENNCPLELIECPETAKVSCGDPFDPVTLGLPFDPETCANIEVEYQDVIGGVCAETLSIKRIWTFKDQDGNMSNCEQMIEFVDETFPTIEAIEDFTLDDCDAAWPDLSTEWSDNCGSGGEVEGVPGEVMTDGCTETLVYTFTVSDDCGNETTVTTTVTRNLDELIISCPEDKKMNACASQADIDAAFQMFLEAFKVESGCNAGGSLDAAYSAPDKCGGSVEVSYTATGDCGEPQTCTATFTVEECTTGECGTCPEACAISGDQLVCPNEVVTYTVDFKDGCENPEVIWSLNETYNDATIVAVDGNSVTLKIDNNCEGWVELIATIKCEGCEDVVCKYPIDVVLTDIVFETPEDVVIDACTDAADIEAAFEDFLKGFSVSGGCNAKGEFEVEYSLPEVCGGNIEIVYNAIADCGQVSSTSATFTIETCEEGSCKECPESCLISGDQLVCPNEWVTYTVTIPEGCENPEVVWTLNETYHDATIVSTDGNTVVLKIDNNCEGWAELIATVKCDGCDDIVCKYPIDVVLTDIVFETPEDVVIDACTDAADIEAAFEDFLKGFSVSGGCNAEGEFEVEYSLPEVCGGNIEIVYNAIADCGQVSSTSATFTIETCEEGSCNECPESCLISGDQLVCPGELVSYMVAIPEGCENPQVIWSLNETYNDATIVGEDPTTNSIVLKIDDNCDAWVELIATVKCDGCEDVVCKYPIDVVLNQLTLDCPDDVVLESCTSQADIDAAFTEFLNAFSFTGGCDAEGEFETEYSAPDKCGGIVEVKYIVTESCGTSKTCSATFKIGICEDGTCNTCEGSCLISGALAPCPGEEVVYTLDLDGTCTEPEVIWTLDGDAEIIETGDGQVTVKVTEECEGWFTLKATVKCDNCPPVYCEKMVDIVRHKLVVECPDDVVVSECLSTSEVEEAFEAFLSNFGFSGACGNGYGDFATYYSAPTGCGESVTVKYIAQDNCGQYEVCTATFSIEDCGNGDCGECPESCLISGDQLVCPGEVVTYTAAIPYGCENPEVIWSLNETYNDATIVSTDGNTVVLKIDDNCDAWVELIAKVKCDGCEPVVCKYPIDVVLTQLTLDCPGDVVLESCSSQADIDAAFEDFLDAFSFTGGCDAEGKFEAEYSAPDKCGGIVEVKYIVTESCGTSKTCSATFKIGICEDGTCNTCEGSCLISGALAPCPGEEVVYTLDLDGTCAEPKVTWTLDGDAEIIETGDGQVTVKVTDECEGWFTLTAKIECDNCPPVYCEKTVDIVRHKLIVECPDDVVVSECLSTSEVEEAFEEFLSSFGFSGACGNGYGDFATYYSAPTGCGESVTVKYIAQDNCGQYEVCTATFSIEDCGNGDCGECPESCLISGDQLVCPGEVVTYTAAIPYGCENPEVIWSLNETYNDATIVSTDGNSVVLKIDDNCDAWVELIAKVKCDGCEPVICKYPIDVVLTELVLDCPDDVVVDACSSQAEIDAAFEDFLDSFGFSGGCNADGKFAAEYSAPTECGTKVEVKYIVTESCGAGKSCTATFRIKDCDQACTPEIKDLEDIVLEECGAEWPTLETEWWDDCGNDATIEGVPGEVMTIDDCYQYRIYTFTVPNACGEDAVSTTKVTRRYDMTAPIIPIPSLNIDLVTCIEDIPTLEGLEALIELSLFDNCDENPDIMISADGSPECVDGSFSYTFTVQVCDECGNCDEIAITYSGACNGTPGEEQTFCTLTQGGWGNPGGKYNWKDGDKAGTTEIIEALISTYGDVIVGDLTANSLSISDAECVLSLLPGGGMPDVLPDGTVIANEANDCLPYDEEYLTGSGRLQNNLAAQTIALQLNMWYTLEVSGAELGALALESLSLEGTGVLPDTVTTVAKLLEFANLYLGGTLGADNGLSGSLTDLLASVNEFFDGCSEVAYDECGLSLGILGDLLDLDPDKGDDEYEDESNDDDDENDLLGMKNQESLSVWPNPASKHLMLNFSAEVKGTVDVRLIDLSGKHVFDGTFPVTEGDNNLIVPIDGFPTGIYTIMTMLDDRQLLKRVVITRR